MPRMFPVILLCLATSLPSGAMAQSKNDPSVVVPPEVAAAAESIMRLFTSLIGAIPTYEAPELMPNGDIIIRRKQPNPAPPPSDKPKKQSPSEPDEDTPTRI